MLSDFLGDAELSFWPLAAMGLFLAAFLAIVTRLILAWRDRDETSRLATLARLPLARDAAEPMAPEQEVQRR